MQIKTKIYWIRCVRLYVYACLAWEVGVCIVMRCQHEPFLLYLTPTDICGSPFQGGISTPTKSLSVVYPCVSIIVFWYPYTFTNLVMMLICKLCVLFDVSPAWCYVKFYVYLKHELMISVSSYMYVYENVLLERCVYVLCCVSCLRLFLLT